MELQERDLDHSGRSTDTDASGLASRTFGKGGWSSSANDPGFYGSGSSLDGWSYRSKMDAPYADGQMRNGRDDEP
jgi:hypothetical protein